MMIYGDDLKVSFRLPRVIDPLSKFDFLAKLRQAGPLRPYRSFANERNPFCGVGRMLLTHLVRYPFSPSQRFDSSPDRFTVK